MYLSIVIVSAVCVSKTMSEEVKFECEHQVLSRIVQLEQDHRVMKYLLTNYQKLEDTNVETARILESQEISLRELGTGYKALSTENEETAEMLKDQETSLRRLETGYTNISAQNEKTVKLLKDRDEDVERLKENYRVCAAEVTSIRSELDILKSTALSKGSGATYTRWGRPDCPGNGSEIVYSGYIAGSYYNHKGAASNHLCLPNEPQWENYRNGWQSEGAIYGAEYHMKNAETFFGKSLQYHVPPCAVCTSKRTSVVMIPARTTCYDGWTKEYGGYLVAGHYDHNAATEYICLDKNPSTVEWSKPGAQNGRLLYMVEGDACSYNMKCPPYEKYKEFTCVVCSK